MKQIQLLFKTYLDALQYAKDNCLIEYEIQPCIHDEQFMILLFYIEEE